MIRRLFNSLNTSQDRVADQNTVQAPTRDQFSEMTQEVFNTILAFTPSSALFLRIISHRVGQNTDTFLGRYRAEIARVCLEMNSPLYILIQRQFGASRNIPALRFHMSVPSVVRSLGFPLAVCPNRILSVLEIHQFARRIENDNLQRVWNGSRQQILNVPGTTGVPAVNASAQQIRTWMRAVENQTLVKRIVQLRLSDTGLSCVPEEISLCTAVNVIAIAANQLISLPERVFQGLPALHELYLSCNQFVTVFRAEHRYQEWHFW